MTSPIAVLFANLKGNVGDFAILDAVLRDLARRYPGHPLHVFPHGYLGVDHARLAAFRRGGAPDFEIVGQAYYRELPRHAKLLSACGIWPRVQARTISALAESSDKDAEKFRDYEAVFVAGGDQWSGKRLGISMFATIAAVRRHNDKIFAYPFSVHPKVRNDNLAGNLKSYFQNVRGPLVARDSISKKVLDEIGVESVLGWDCVYGLRDLAEEIESHRDRNPDRTIIAVTRQTGGASQFEAAMRQTLRNLVPHVKPLELLTTCALADGELYGKLGAEFGIPVRAPLDWQEVVAEFKASKVVITNRLHGLILGSLSDTALIPVTDRKKAAAFAEDADVLYRAESVADISAALIAETKADRASVIGRVAAYRRKSGGGHLSPIFAPR